MRSARHAVLTSCFMLLPALVSAWGATGHRVIGRVAEGHLSPVARQEVRALLGHASLARASTWPDEIKSDPEWRDANPPHWVTIPDGQTYENTKKNPNGDVIQGIERVRAVLGNRALPTDERTVALKFLAHYIGDLHQPLHVGCGDDRGGNEVLVLWHSEPSNLHRVWDSDMINFTRLSFSEWTDFLDRPSAEQVADWQGTQILDWATESMNARAQVYDIGDRRLGYRYSYVNRALLERRLLQAGVRLAGLLNEIFAPAADGR